MSTYLFVLLMILIGIGGEFVVVLKQVGDKRRRAKDGVVCPKCGKKLPDDSIYCEHCGAALPTNYNVQIPVKWLYFVMAVGITFCTFLASGLIDAVDFEYDRYMWVIGMFYIMLSIVAICALIQAFRLRLHWHDCLVVWAFLAILTISLIWGKEYLGIVFYLTILLAVYYLVVNVVTHYLPKK